MYEKSHHYGNLGKMQEIFNKKYGLGTRNTYGDTFFYYGKDIKIELINYSLGRWGIQYTEDDSNL